MMAELDLCINFLMAMNCTMTAKDTISSSNICRCRYLLVRNNILSDTHLLNEACCSAIPRNVYDNTLPYTQFALDMV